MENIRPLAFDDFIGQEDAKRRLQVAIASAQTRNKPLGHILLSGPAGLGKTTLAQIVANTTNVFILFTIGNNITKDTDLYNLIDRVTRENAVNILFIDEIHTIRSIAQNNLLTAMEDFSISIKKNGHSQRYNFAPITIIGATTNPGNLLKPVYDRFDHKVVLEPYTPTELQSIVKFTVSKLDYVEGITDKAVAEIAKRSRGVARIATKFCKSAQDIACVNQKNIIDDEIIAETFEMLDIDEKGLSTKVDVKILKYLFNIYPQAIGADNMAQLLDEDPRHVLNVVEPNLFKLGYIERGRGGRSITPKGMTYLKENGHITTNDVNSSAMTLEA